MIEIKTFTREELDAKALILFREKKELFNKRDKDNGLSETDLAFRRDHEILLAAYVGAARLLSGLSRTKAREATGIDSSYWNRMEAMQKTLLPVPENTARKMAVKLNIDPKWIMEPYLKAKKEAPEIAHEIVASGTAPFHIVKNRNGQLAVTLYGTIDPQNCKIRI